jgi:hypothetical protein
MSNPMNSRGRARETQIPQGEAVAEFDSYQQATKLVNKLVANDFPPSLISIIGDDLKLVETIRGKLGYGRVALSGALTGSWIGLIFGLLFGAGIVVDPAGDVAYQPQNFLSALVIGAGIGMLFNIIRFSASKNRREFLSYPQTIARTYRVVVPATELSKARSLVSIPD